ncbi:hypothetical protein BH708_06040 [Brachybacterium sp. P6-10-X1]|nr:hypothetical protein BH708_06040 [Brachybacterium sp. P6-10-X1]
MVLVVSAGPVAPSWDHVLVLQRPGVVTVAGLLRTLVTEMLMAYVYTDVRAPADLVDRSVASGGDARCSRRDRR